MAQEFPYDDEPARSHSEPGAGAHGQAAILLVESLIHALVARSVLSVPEAIDVIRSAIEVAEDISAERGAIAPNSQHALDILISISSSFEYDNRG